MRFGLRARHIAAVALVLGLTIAAFILARALTERQARRDSDRRVEVAAAQIRDRMQQGTSLAESLSRYMYDSSGTGVTSDQFQRTVLRWLSPAGFPAAAWAQQVSAGGRTVYEQLGGQPIVTPNDPNAPAPTSSSYLPATLVSGFTPMDLTGVDLRREPGIAAALLRARSPGQVAATPVTEARGPTSGLFLVAPAPNLIDGVLKPGAVVVFVSEAALLASANNPPGLRLVSDSRSSGSVVAGNTVRKDFSVAGGGFAVVLPTESVGGAAAAVPWLILIAGVIVSALVAGFSVSAGRRAKAQAEVDRIFNLSSDLIVAADFEGHFTRVNPAVEQILGYTREEFLERPYLELVHPDDREKTAQEAAGLAQGRQTRSFENRYRHNDGSFRTLEWTSTPVAKDGLMYGIARDVTARRRVETESERLADEQAALRRVATVVARGASRGEVFDAIAQEFGQLIDADFIEMLRFEDDHTAVSEASGGAAAEAFAVGSRVELGGDNAASLILRTGQPVRIDDYHRVATGPIAEAAQSTGLRSAVGAPLVVDDRLWGAVTLGTTGDGPLPPDTEARLTQFTELMATAIANTETRGEVERLADEQAALRRVATVVARGGSRREVFNAIAEEMRQLIGADFIDMLRYEDDRTVVSVAAGGVASGAFVVGTRFELRGDNATSRMHRTGQTVRIDDYDRTATGPIAEAAHTTGLRSVVGTPLVVEDRLWGAVTIGTTGEEPLPPDTESRLEQFTELMATAIANTESREALGQLTDEQAALRRVATVVARGASRTEVFNAIAEEVRQLIEADLFASVLRYVDDRTVVLVATAGAAVEAFAVGSRHALGGHNASSLIMLTRQPVRIDNYDRSASGPIGKTTAPARLRSIVATPLIVDDRLWGAVMIGTTGAEPLPPDTERAAWPATPAALPAPDTGDSAPPGRTSAAGRTATEVQSLPMTCIPVAVSCGPWPGP